MRNAYLLLVALTCVAVSGVATAQTAREYFNELRDANAFNHYGDEYVCFPEQDKGAFDIIAKSEDVERMAAAEDKKASAKPKPKPKPSQEEGLVVQRYFKGVASGAQVFEKIGKDADERWSLEFKVPMHGRMDYKVNWITGRYRLSVFNLDHSKTLPAAEISGKCELIHPWSPPPSK